jgi:methylenetetrahydrofolate reductase (NADPH)
MNSGKDMAGNELDGGIDFCIGTTATPSADPLEPQLIKVEKKLKAGVSFIQTQAVYELDELKRFTEFVRNMDGKVKILAGIVPVIGAKMAAYMNENVPGIFIPQHLINELAQAPKGTGVSKGIEIAARMIKQIKKERICDGVHIMFIGREERVPEILEAAELP